jgi:hypothetical protein
VPHALPSLRRFAGRALSSNDWTPVERLFATPIRALQKPLRVEVSSRARRQKLLGSSYARASVRVDRRLSGGSARPTTACNRQCRLHSSLVGCSHSSLSGVATRLNRFTDGVTSTVRIESRRFTSTERAAPRAARSAVAQNKVRFDLFPLKHHRAARRRSWPNHGRRSSTILCLPR